MVTTGPGGISPTGVRSRVARQFAARERLTERFGDATHQHYLADPDGPRYSAQELMHLVLGHAQPHQPATDSSPRPNAADLADVLTWVRQAYHDLEGLEENLIRLARTARSGRATLTWGDIADALGLASPQAAQQRYARRGLTFAYDRPDLLRPPATDPPHDDE